MSLPFFQLGTLAFKMSTSAFNSTKDAEAVYNAMKGIGTNEQAMISTLANKTPAQLNAIAADYIKAYGKDLNSALESETSGNFKKALTSLGIIK